MHPFGQFTFDFFAVFQQHGPEHDETEQDGKPAW